MTKKRIQMNGEFDGKVEIDFQNGTKTLRLDEKDVVILLCKLKGMEVKEDTGYTKKDVEKRVEWLIGNLQHIKKQLC
jgi:hypothetical protein